MEDRARPQVIKLGGRLRPRPLLNKPGGRGLPEGEARAVRKCGASHLRHQHPRAAGNGLGWMSWAWRRARGSSEKWLMLLSRHHTLHRAQSCSLALPRASTCVPLCCSFHRLRSFVSDRRRLQPTKAHESKKGPGREHHGLVSFFAGRQWVGRRKSETYLVDAVPGDDRF